jgi:hypothetical protein
MYSEFGGFIGKLGGGGHQQYSRHSMTTKARGYCIAAARAMVWSEKNRAVRNKSASPWIAPSRGYILQSSLSAPTENDVNKNSK